MTTLNWRNPKEALPVEGEIVWVITQHWKEHNPLSCELVCGEVEIIPQLGKIRVNTADFTGKGCWSVYLEGGEGYDEKGLAWIPASEFPLPPWIPHEGKTKP